MLSLAGAHKIERLNDVLEQVQGNRDVSAPFFNEKIDALTWDEG